MTYRSSHLPLFLLEYAAIVLIIAAVLSILNPVRWIEAILGYAGAL